MSCWNSNAKTWSGGDQVPRRTLVVKLHAAGVNESLRSLNKLGKDANKAIRDASEQLARDLATSAANAARADSSPQSALVAGTVRAARDRVPAVQAGGSARVGGRGAPAFGVLFGAEFGANRYAQFGHPHRGTEGYWFFPTVEREQAAILRRWDAAVDTVVKQFGGEV